MKIQPFPPGAKLTELHPDIIAWAGATPTVLHQLLIPLGTMLGWLWRHYQHTWLTTPCRQAHTGKLQSTLHLRIQPIIHSICSYRADFCFLVWACVHTTSAAAGLMWKITKIHMKNTYIVKLDGTKTRCKLCNSMTDISGCEWQEYHSLQSDWYPFLI